MTVLLTGANGQLGQDFQKLYRQQGIEFVATDYREGNGCLALDITDENAVRDFLVTHPVNMIINCAAYNNVDGAETDRDNAMKLNCRAPENLALRAKERGIAYMTYSTDFVFAGDGKDQLTEADIPKPISAYGESKRAGEIAVLAAYDKALVVRTAWVFGMGNDNFIKKVIRWSEGKEVLKVVDDEVSCPTYSWDLAVYSWKLITKNAHGLYHLTNNGIASRNDFARYILTKINWKGQLETSKQADFKLPAKRPVFSKMSIDKVESLLGEKIPTWQDAVDRFMAEMQ